MLIIVDLAALMLTINSANNDDVYFNPTFKLKYGIIIITEDLNIKLKRTCLNSFIGSGFCISSF